MSDWSLELLQKLVFVLYKYSNEDRFSRIHFLPPLYKDILSKYLSKSKELTHLHVAIDRSKETFDMIDVIATTLPHLTKVVLQATVTSHNVPFCIDSVNTLFLQSPCSYYKSMALNVLLGRLLKNTAIRSLEIIGLDIVTPGTGTSNMVRYILLQFTPTIFNTSELFKMRFVTSASLYVQNCWRSNMLILVQKIWNVLYTTRYLKYHMINVLIYGGWFTLVQNLSGLIKLISKQSEVVCLINILTTSGMIILLKSALVNLLMMKMMNMTHCMSSYRIKLVKVF